MLRGWKTILWNVANAIVGAMALAEAAYAIPAEWLPWWIGVYIAGNFVLPFVTTGPVGGKDE